MLLKFSTSNNAWVFLYGDSVIQVGDNPRFFNHLSDALKVAKQQGLTVKFGKVTAS